MRFLLELFKRLDRYVTEDFDEYSVHLWAQNRRSR